MDGKSVLITGGGSGIGAALATELAKQGATIIIGDVNDCEKLAQKLRAETKTERIHALSLDVTDFTSQQRFFRKAAEITGGNINHVIVNAGINQVCLPAFDIPVKKSRGQGIPKI